MMNAAGATAICSNCGSRNIGMQTACLYCNAPLDGSSAPELKKCPACGYARAAEEGMQFCMRCGASYERRCANPTCGKALAETATFCKYCGTLVAGAPQPALAPAAMPFAAPPPVAPPPVAMPPPAPPPAAMPPPVPSQMPFAHPQQAPPPMAAPAGIAFALPQQAPAPMPAPQAGPPRPGPLPPPSVGPGPPPIAGPPVQAACPKCRQPVGPGKKFCTNCGTRVA